MSASVNRSPQQERASPGQPILQFPDHSKNVSESLLVCPLRFGEPRAVDPVVEVQIYAVVQRIDLFPEVIRIKIDRRICHFDEAEIENA